MSFTFIWPRFSDQFHYDAIQMLNTALNKGPQPPVIADKIEVIELQMGTQVHVNSSSIKPTVSQYPISHQSSKSATLEN
jgi:hypothetical protein